MTVTDAEQVLLAIPARGGSKRLPRKNLLNVAGVPMIVHTIRAAIDSGLSQRVYVCTEDDEIASVSSDAGAEVFRIPSELAEDDVSSTVPVLKLSDHLRETGMFRDDGLIFNLQPTSPLRTAADITGCLDALVTAGADFAVSVTEIDPHYFHWALQRNGSSWGMYFRDKFLKERIYLPSVMRPNGAIKLAKAKALKRSGNYFGDPLAVFNMPEERSIHVGTAFDLDCARAIAQKPD